MEKCFNQADLNKDGKINEHEFKQMMLTLFHDRLDDDEIIRLFKQFDADNNGEIDIKGIYKSLIINI